MLIEQNRIAKYKRKMKIKNLINLSFCKLCCQHKRVSNVLNSKTLVLIIERFFENLIRDKNQIVYLIKPFYCRKKKSSLTPHGNDNMCFILRIESIF